MEIIEEQIIKENTNLIWKIAQNFYNVDKLDLFQAGALGLIKAYRKYKNNGTTKFSSYAFKYIYGQMYELACNKELKVGKDLRKLRLQIEKMRYTLAQTLERVPSNHELAEYLEMDEEKIEMALQCADTVMSLDDERNDTRNLYETIIQETDLCEDDRILLTNSLDTLKPLEKDIITSRYFEDLTQSETAKKLGITQVMVSRYETKSLEKMRNFMYM